MSLITNYASLGSNVSRKIVLNLVEAGLNSIQPETVLKNYFNLDGDNLKIQDRSYDLKNYDRLFLIGFGKGSAKISKIIESSLDGKLTRGFVIDVSEDRFTKCEFSLATHPLPSEQNLEFSKKVLSQLTNLKDRDLILIVICGGGSVMFEDPFSISLQKLIEVNDALLKSGADIIEVNTIRKHLSKTKGGGLVKLFNPAKVVSLIFSDVPGNDLSFIASGPTVKDETTLSDALSIYRAKNLQSLNLAESDFTETPKEDSLFERVDNILMLSNLTALNAMKAEAEKWGIQAEIYSDKYKNEALEAGRDLVQKAKENSVLLVGGETTVSVKNPQGKGGRNQHLVLSSLDVLGENTTIVSIDSDGWDNSPAAGAIGDFETLEKAKKTQINPKDYLNQDNSFLFFNSIEDAIITNRLPSNVSDLILVYKHD